MSVQYSWPSANSWPKLPFPASIAPTVWLDGNQAAYSDSAGTLPVTSGLIRRINEAAPLSGVWSSVNDADRPLRDSNGARFELNSGDGGAGMTRPAATGINAAACTLCVSFVARASAIGGPQAGLFVSDDSNVGIAIGSNAVWVLHNGSFWFSPLLVAHGQRNTIFVSYSATGIDLVVNAGGSVTTASLVVAVTATSLASTWRVGQYGSSFIYASIPQAIAVARTIPAGVERDALLTWAHSQQAPVAYATDRPLVAFIGDSITAMTATSEGNGYPFLFQQAARGVSNAAEVCDTALGGIGVPGLLAPGGVLMRANAFYSAARAKNIAVMLLGSNDLVGGNSVQYLVNGVGAVGGNGLYQGCDFLRAAGWTVALLTIGPRSDATAIANGFNALRAAANVEILANGHLHADVVLDTTQITNFGFDGDSNNASFYSADLIHPINAGHARLATVTTPALLALL